MKPPPILECQDCGIKLRDLTPEEDRRVTENPYNYIVYCNECKRVHLGDS
jgi:uncharacterized protein with PIN domain